MPVLYCSQIPKEKGFRFGKLESLSHPFSFHFPGSSSMQNGSGFSLENDVFTKPIVQLAFLGAKFVKFRAYVTAIAGLCNQSCSMH